MSTQTMIQQIAEYFKTQPVLKAWLFGSYSRGEQRDDSDVDMLTFEFREAHSDLKWRQITNMRNFLIHGYHNVEEDLVWEAIAVDLQPIREKIVKYLEEFNTAWNNWPMPLALTPVAAGNTRWNEE